MRNIQNFFGKNKQTSKQKKKNKKKNKKEKKKTKQTNNPLPDFLNLKTTEISDF